MRDDPALAQLRMRLARGEVTRDEFARTEALLEQTPAPNSRDGASTPFPPVTGNLHSSGSRSTRALVIGSTLSIGALLAGLLSFAPWYSILGVNVNPWFVSGYGATEWWLAHPETGIQGADLVRWVGPASAVGLLFALAGGATIIQEKRIRLAAVIMATFGMGVYGSATALTIVIAFKNGLDVGAWSFGLWGSVVSTMAMLGAGAFLSPEKTLVAPPSPT